MPRIRSVGLLLPCLLVALGFRAPAVEEACSVAPHASWKSSVSFPADPFLVDPWPNPRWVKFTILRCDPGRVYFQDGGQFPFHHDFATTHLDPLRGLTRSEFDARTLHLEGQQAVLGAVIFPPSIVANSSAFGIQLVGKDPYPPMTSSRSSRRSRPASREEALRPSYFPAYEQQAAAERDAAYLAERGSWHRIPGPLG